MEIATTPTTQLIREITGDGPENAAIVILTDTATYDDNVTGRLLTSYAARALFDQFRKFGVLRSHMRIEAVCERVVAWDTLLEHERVAWRADAVERLRALSPNVIVPLGDVALATVTDKRSAEKWQLSIIPTFWGTKCVPLLHPSRIIKNYKDLPFITFGAERVVAESKTPDLRLTERHLKTRPTFNEACVFLRECETADWLSVDIETGRGQITCIAFSFRPDLAMSIPTLPGDWANESEFYDLWCAIARALESSARKVFQNGIYDTTYLARYGIRVRNFAHDTMIAQRVLHAELPMGLDTIARIYTREPYWKDDAKDWGTRQDVNALYSYNARDAAVTLEAAMAQRLDLTQRNLTSLFDDYYMRGIVPCVAEMCWNGLPVNAETKTRLHDEAERVVNELQTTFEKETTAIVGKPVNPRSPAQVKELLRMSRMKLPVKNGKETSDREALLRLRLKRPDVPFLATLIRLSGEQKRLSSYLSYEYDADGHMRYSLLAHGTETGRMSCYQDPWGRGLNAQTIPAALRIMYEVPDDEVFIEVDLKQAESRFVAWDAPEPTFIAMYRDGVDTHRYVASRPGLFGGKPEQVTKEQRQLGKKVTHASNYGMGPGTLAASCLKEMDLVLPVSRAEQMLEGYHTEFPGIRRWHARLREEVIRNRVIRVPLGGERYFYDRPGDSLWRELYAYRPQRVVANVINRLLIHMRGHARLILQTHDAILIRVKASDAKTILARICDQNAWNPTIPLLGGDLRIPIEVKMGRVWGKLEEVFSG